MTEEKKDSKKVRFAVVGLGYISQVAVLPAFANADSHCELTALVSSDPEKLEVIGKRYRVKELYTYDEYEACLRSGNIDAVYIALPNSMHCDFVIKAAQAGVHVLCEKPMAVTQDECLQMIEACKANEVKLMIAYRLHFEEANLSAVELVASGKLGDPRIFSSVFSMQVKDGDIRTRGDLGGGALFDIGIYCINAARYLFKAEPKSVTAIVSNPPDKRFEEIDGLTGALMDFEKGRVACFVASFGAADTSSYEVIGTKGVLRVSPAYDFHEELSYELTINGRSTKKAFSKRDQFAPELIRFAESIRGNRELESCGIEGLADIRIIEAIKRSAQEGRRIELPPFEKKVRPTMKQELKIPPAKKPSLFHAKRPSPEN